MSRIEWGRYGDDVEHVIGMLLCVSNPDAQLIRPSQGDGGIDVLVPIDGDDRHIDVYQVKRFTQNLDDSQKRQIKKSLKRLVSFTAEGNYRVRNWYATMPLLRTNEYRDWLDTIATETGATFRCEWRGLHLIDALAAEHPKIIDYYLRDGRERLEASIASLTALLRQREDVRSASPEGPYEPAEATAGLGALHTALNAHDPHFRYDFEVTSDPREIGEESRLVGAVQREIDGSWVTVKIYAISRQSVIERAIPISFTLHVERGSELERDIRDSERYGRPFEAPTGSVLSGSIDLPGGFVQDLTGGSVSIRRASTVGGSQDRRLQILDPAGATLCETLVELEPATRGFSGAWTKGRDRGGAFDFELFVDHEEGLGRINFSRRDVVGRAPARVLPGLRLLAYLHQPYLLRFALPFGVIAHPGMPLEGDPGNVEYERLVARIVDALSRIQEHVATQIQIPDLNSLTYGEATRLVEDAELLDGGEKTVRWERLVVHLHPGKELEVSEEPFAVLLRQPVELLINGIRVELGIRQTYVAGAQYDFEAGVTPHDDHFDAVVVPYQDSPAKLRHFPPAAVAAAAGIG